MHTADVAEPLATRLRIYPRNGGDYAVSFEGESATIWRQRAEPCRTTATGWWFAGWEAFATGTWTGIALVQVEPLLGPVEVGEDVIAAAEDCLLCTRMAVAA